MGNISAEQMHQLHRLIMGVGVCMLLLFVLILWGIIGLLNALEVDAIILVPLCLALSLFSPWVRKAVIASSAVAVLAAMTAAPVVYTFIVSHSASSKAGEVHTPLDDSWALFWPIVLSVTWAVLFAISLLAGVRFNPGRQAVRSAAKQALLDGSSYLHMARSMKMAAAFNVLLFVIAPAVLLAWFGAIVDWHNRVGATTAVGEVSFAASIARHSATSLYSLALVYCVVAGLYALAHTRGDLAIMSYDVGKEALQREASQIDASVEACLTSGAIRLVATEWIEASAPTILPQRQALPEGAFLSAAQAVEAHRAGRVFVLSYRWHTATHPDPTGATLEHVRGFLRTLPRSGHENTLRQHEPSGQPSEPSTGLFWDWASLPQRPRTESEDAAFRQGLHCMGNLYGSLMRTTVLRCKRIPPRPASHDGRLRVRRARSSEPLSTAEVVDLCSNFGEVHSCELEGGDGFLVRYAAHEAVHAAVAGWAALAAHLSSDFDLAAEPTWNDKPYDASGWCTFESGAAMLAAGHRHRRLERHGAYRGLSQELPAKLIDIGDSGDSGDGVHRRAELVQPPELSRLEAAIGAAAFTGAADRLKVVQMLREFNTLLELQPVDGETHAVITVKKGTVKAFGLEDSGGDTHPLTHPLTQMV